MQETNNVSEEINKVYKTVDLLPKYVIRIIIHSAFLGLLMACNVFILDKVIDHVWTLELPMGYGQWLSLVVVAFGISVSVTGILRINSLFKMVMAIYALMYNDLTHLTQFIRSTKNIQIIKLNADDVPLDLIKDVIGGKKGGGGETIH